MRGIGASPALARSRRAFVPREIASQAARMTISTKPALRKALFAGSFLLGLLAACSSPEQPSEAGPQPVELGLGCATSADCVSGLCIAEARGASGVSWTAGTCSQACSAAGVCPAASACVAFDDGSALCLGGCARSEDCRAGYVCSSAVGACLPDCRLGFSCGTSLGCDSATGACVPGTGAIGAACGVDGDCKSGLCSPEQAVASGKAWEGGYCTQACGSSLPCEDAASCLTYDDGSSYCAATCSASSDCRTSYVCSASAKVCLPDCRQGWSCGAVLTCDGATGNCVGKMLPIGAPCAANLDCASALCTPAQSTSAGTAWSGGYCTALCSTSTPCPSPAACVVYADGSACAAGCAVSTDCRAGYVCSPGVGACLPDCRQGWSCGSALVCDPTTGACA